jgi:hypothetical protein
MARLIGGLTLRVKVNAGVNHFPTVILMMLLALLTVIVVVGTIEPLEFVENGRLNTRNCVGLWLSPTT